MTSIASSSSLVSRFAITNAQTLPEGYYRSKLFIPATSSNPILSSASPIFSLLERLGLSTTLPPIEDIRSNIEHELHAFQCRLIRKNYAEELAAIAHYLLCATIDELIGKNYLRVLGTPVTFVAFTPLSSEQQNPQHLFFEIVTHLKEKTNQYLDLIELSYYCLIIGFEGEKHLLSDGRQSLENLIEELYQLINQYRVHRPTQPFNKIIAPTPSPPSYKPIAVMSLVTVGIIAALWYFSHALLEHKAATLLLERQTLRTSTDLK